MQEGLQTRFIIHQILKELKISSSNFDEIFDKKIKNKIISLSDKKFIYSVVLNSMRNFIYIDHIINKFSKKNNKLSDSYFLLLSAITQLLILSFKDFAVVNSTVELSKDNRIKAPTKFINAVLRTVIRNKNILLKKNIKFSNLPSWFTNKVSWSVKSKENFLKTIKEEPSLHLVYKNNKNIKKIHNDFIQTTEYSIAINNRSLISNIDGYKEGLWWVQDFSSMLPIYLLNNLENKQVADLCAAPGGKSFQLIMKNAIVTAFEKNSKRVRLMKKNLQRLNLDCKIVIKDILKYDNQQKFDVIILDAPCSSIGTIRRHPEIFFRNKSPDFDKIVSIQNNLLDKAKDLLTKNGLLIYMVCSFLNEEGKNIIRSFLKKNKNFTLQKFSKKIVKDIDPYLDIDGSYYVLPQKLKNTVLIDGFFAAKLRKND